MAWLDLGSFLSLLLIDELKWIGESDSLTIDKGAVRTLEQAWVIDVTGETKRIIIAYSTLPYFVRVLSKLLMRVADSQHFLMPAQNIILGYIQSPGLFLFTSFENPRHWYFKTTIIG